MEKKPSFEESASRIEEIVKLLERGETPLDKSLELFEEGAKLIKECGLMLDEAEQRVKSFQTDSSKETIMETLFEIE